MTNIVSHWREIDLFRIGVSFSLKNADASTTLAQRAIENRSRKVGLAAKLTAPRSLVSRLASCFLYENSRTIIKNNRDLCLYHAA
jgi:hypothetical protein